MKITDPSDAIVHAHDTADSILEYQWYLIGGSRRPDQAVKAILELEKIRVRQLKLVDDLLKIIEA
jgi:hypothetical protein